MIYKLINYLCNLPTPTTSPIYLAVNTPEMLALMGDGVSEVAVIQNQAQNLVAPYVRLREIAQVGSGPVTEGDGYLNMPAMMVDYISASKDATGFEARDRCTALRIAVEQAIARAKNSVSDQLTLLDPNGSSARDQIQDWYIEPVRVDPVLVGPGEIANKPFWTALSMSRVTLIQYSQRGLPY